MGTRRKIFISYRRDDAPADASHLYDRLVRTFGKPNVFMDVDKVWAGQRFDHVLDEARSQCDVLIAVIGRRWMELLSDRARSGSSDFVHDEIAAALGVALSFWIAALGVSYSGFALSAAVVVRVHRRAAGPMLVAHATSMFVALMASTVTIEVLSRLWDNRVPVPHTLFYVVSVALPYHWRSGLLLAPAVMLMAGLLASPRPRREDLEARPSAAS